jgi:hypothetical protein
MLTVRHTLYGLSARFKRASTAMKGEAGRQAMTAIGLQTLGWTIEDYRAKARGGTDEAGVKWPRIRRESIASRLLKRKVGLPVLKMLRRGSANRKRNAAIIWLAANDPGFMPEFYRAVSTEHARHEVGIDTGRQVSSLSYGVPGAPRPGPIQHTSEAPSKAVWVVKEASVELGTRQRYAGWFAARRPIFPRGMISPRRKKVLAVIWSRVAMSVLAG